MREILAKWLKASFQPADRRWDEMTYKEVKSSHADIGRPIRNHCADISPPVETPI
jgi:hypothetical protein